MFDNLIHAANLLAKQLEHDRKFEQVDDTEVIDLLHSKVRAV